MDQQTTTQPYVEVVDIQFRPGQKVYYFDPGAQSMATVPPATTKSRPRM